MIRDSSYYLSLLRHILFFIVIPLYFGLKLIQGNITPDEQMFVGWILIIFSLIIGIWAIKNHNEEYKDHFGDKSKNEIKKKRK